VNRIRNEFPVCGTITPQFISHYLPGFVSIPPPPARRMAYVDRRLSKVGMGLKAIEEALTYLPEDNLVIRADVLAYYAMSLCFNGRRGDADVGWGSTYGEGRLPHSCHGRPLHP
jgi:hypothetical protein